jgi:hypothetical protein
VSGDQSQTYSDLSISSQSLSSAVNAYQSPSAITDLDETVKSTPLKSSHVAREIVERYDEGVFDDGGESQTEEDENNSVVIADSDDEDQIAHFDSNDDHNNQQPLNEDYLTDIKNNNKSIEAQSVDLGSYPDVTIEVYIFFSLDLYEEDVYDNLKTNDNNALRNASEA